MKSRFESRLGRCDNVEVDSADVDLSLQIVLLSPRARLGCAPAHSEDTFHKANVSPAQPSNLTGAHRCVQRQQCCKSRILPLGFARSEPQQPELFIMR
jgi:hypothetical protein